MGLASQLGYAQGEQNAIRRAVVAVVSTRPVSAVSRKILPSVDRFVSRITGGKSTMTSMTSGLPVLWLTTRGAKTGSERTVPLLGFPVGGDLAVLGTHFGHRTTPGWVRNLEADPGARVAYRGTQVVVRARSADPSETESTWEKAASAYPGYENYAGRASHRQIRVFVLEPGEIDEQQPRVGS